MTTHLTGSAIRRDGETHRVPPIRPLRHVEGQEFTVALRLSDDDLFDLMTELAKALRRHPNLMTTAIRATQLSVRARAVRTLVDVPEVRDALTFVLSTADAEELRDEIEPLLDPPERCRHWATSEGCENWASPGSELCEPCDPDQ